MRKILATALVSASLFGLAACGDDGGSELGSGGGGGGGNSSSFCAALEKYQDLGQSYADFESLGDFDINDLLPAVKEIASKAPSELSKDAKAWASMTEDLIKDAKKSTDDPVGQLMAMAMAGMDDPDYEAATERLGDYADRECDLPDRDVDTPTVGGRDGDDDPDPIGGRDGGTSQGLGGRGGRSGLEGLGGTKGLEDFDFSQFEGLEGFEGIEDLEGLLKDLEGALDDLDLDEFEEMMKRYGG